MLETSRGSLTNGGMECKSEMQSLSGVNLHEGAHQVHIALTLIAL